MIVTHIDNMAAPAMSIRSPLARAQHAVPVTRASAPRSAPFVGRPALALRKVGMSSQKEYAGVPKGNHILAQMCPMMIMTKGQIVAKGDLRHRTDMACISRPEWTDQGLNINVGSEG